ncbi:hypothetical protein HYQ46_008985 [Verticillium longisporum]|nr:hypothetical protein HYQ46_008985 [Verticillium longisporum]
MRNDRMDRPRSPMRRDNRDRPFERRDDRRRSRSPFIRLLGLVADSGPVHEAQAVAGVRDISQVHSTGAHRRRGIRLCRLP